MATTDAGQGIRVAEWGDADVEETFRLRILLEAHATELAVARGGSALVEQLEDCNRRMAAAIAAGGDAAVTAIQAINRDFHRTLLAFAGSPRLRLILEPMIDMPVVIRSFYLYTPAELLQSLHHHEDIVMAARLQDAELGRRAMQLHLKMSQARVQHHRVAWRQSAKEPGTVRSFDPRPKPWRRYPERRPVGRQDHHDRRRDDYGADSGRHPAHAHCRIDIPLGLLWGDLTGILDRAD